MSLLAVRKGDSGEKIRDLGVVPVSRRSRQDQGVQWVGLGSTEAQKVPKWMISSASHVPWFNPPETAAFSLWRPWPDPVQHFLSFSTWSKLINHRLCSIYLWTLQLGQSRKMGS